MFILVYPILGAHHQLESARSTKLEYLPRNVVILPLEDSGPSLTGAAEFCLDVVLHRDGYIDEIWIISSRQTYEKISRAQFSAWGANLQVKYFHLDSKKWPLDVGNNLSLRLPISVYSALREHHIPERIYTPLNGAGAFFALQARKGGLIRETTKFITTCYLPRRLEVSGSLILPQNINNVVVSELEECCASFSDEVWVSHEMITDDISKVLKIPNKDRIFALPLPAVRSRLKPAGRHIIFSGQSLPLYGFDAFCDLAVRLEDELEEVSIFIHSKCDNTASKWSKIARNRLRKLNFTMNWISYDNPRALLEMLNNVDQGVFVALMRTFCLPAEARTAIAAGFTTLWGTGFDLKLPSMLSPGLHTVVSDARKADGAIRDIWEEPYAERQKPVLFKQSKKPSPETLTGKLYPPIKLLSVIITHHNRPNFLAQCLTSLEKQTDTDFEVIIVDDGSAQDLLEKAEVIAQESSLELIKLSKIENSYPAAARNHGVELARGDALFFVDDDNILDPRSIAAFKKAIKNHDLGLSFFQTFEGDSPEFSNVKVNQGHADLKGPTYGFAGLLPGCGLFHNLTGNASVIIRREAFEKLGGFSSKFGVGLEDYALMLKGAFRGGLSWGVLPEAYLHFR